MKGYMERRCTALLFLNLVTRQKRMVNFTLRPLYPRKRTPVPIAQEAGEPQSWAGRFAD